MDIEHYHALLANTADFMVARLNASVVFVPMELKKSDVQQSHAVVARMQYAQRATVLKGEYTSSQMLALIGRFPVLCGHASALPDLRGPVRCSVRGAALRIRKSRVFSMSWICPCRR